MKSKNCKFNKSTQFARIHTCSLINTEKILRRSITKFCNRDDIMRFWQSTGSLKRDQPLFIMNIIFYKKNINRCKPSFENQILKIEVFVLVSGHSPLDNCPHEIPSRLLPPDFCPWTITPD